MGGHLPRVSTRGYYNQTLSAFFHFVLLNFLIKLFTSCFFHKSLYAAAYQLIFFYHLWFLAGALNNLASFMVVLFYPNSSLWGCTFFTQTNATFRVSAVFHLFS